jgi:hypothetical protein
VAGWSVAANSKTLFVGDAEIPVLRSRKTLKKTFCFCISFVFSEISTIVSFKSN